MKLRDIDGNIIYPTILDENGIDIHDKINSFNNDLDKRLYSNISYNKSILVEMPLLFKDYDSIIEMTGAEYIYPQGFNIDFENKEIYVVYAPNGGNDKTRWIAIFDLDTGIYKYCFGAGVAGGEGLVVKYENNKKYLYVKNGSTSLGKFDLTIKPLNKSKLTPVEEYDVGLFFDFAYKDGIWAIEEGGASLGQTIRRNVIDFYNDDFDKIGMLKVPVNIGGTWLGAYTDYIPKRQGLAIGNNCIIQSTGGYWGEELEPSNYNYLGIKIINSDGSLRTEFLLNPKKFSNKLNSLGYKSTRIEYEGTVFHNNDLYSICVIMGRFDADANKKGVIIIKEFSNDKTAIDFSDCAAHYISSNLTELSNGIYPRSADGNMYNCFTGELFTSLNQIIDFMSECDMKKFSYYSSAASIEYPEGITISNGCYVEIVNSNNLTFFINVIGMNQDCVIISYVNNYGRQYKQIKGEELYDIPLENGITNYFETSPLQVKRIDNKNITMIGTIKDIPTDRPVLIGYLPIGWSPKNNLSFNVALSASTNGGYGIIQILANREIRLVYTSSNVDFCCLNGISWFI